MNKSFSVRQAQEFDRNAQTKLGIPSIVLMENAGSGVAEVICNAKDIKRNACKIIVCGTGNNGGDGFVAARHLLNAGVKVKVYVVGSKAKLKADPKTNLNVLLKMGQKIKWIKSTKDFGGIERASLIIDALFGIGLNQPVSGLYYNMIKAINELGVPVLAVDVPSGLNADTGEVMGIAVKAKTTVTFVAAKKGFFKAAGPKHCGKIVVRDIGIK
jgi:hydroxyethylthiazole kinase-like uncharacterized protein yjeF